MKSRLVRQPIVTKTEREIRIVSGLGLVREPNATAHYLFCVKAGMSTYSDSTECHIVSGLVGQPIQTVQNFLFLCKACQSIHQCPWSNQAGTHTSTHGQIKAAPTRAPIKTAPMASTHERIKLAPTRAPVVKSRQHPQQHP